MLPEDALIALGEVAAAFAGFSGVVGALGARSVPELSSAARFRFTNLLVVSVAAALFAFVPVVLSQFTATSQVIWGWSSASLCLFAGTLFFVRWPEGRRLGRAQPGSLRTWVAFCWMLVLALVTAAQLSNLAAWPTARGGALYVAGVFGLLALSGLQFISLALPGELAEQSDHAP